jgi:hypothetical protein
MIDKPKIGDFIVAEYNSLKWYGIITEISNTNDWHHVNYCCKRIGSKKIYNLGCRESLSYWNILEDK